MKSQTVRESATEYIEFIDYLDKQAKYQNVISYLDNLSKSSGYKEIQDPNSLRILAKLSNKHACKFLKENKHAEALDLLELGQAIMKLPKAQKMEELDKMKLTLYNNLCVYACKMKQYDLALKFLKTARHLADAASYELKAAFYGNMAAVYTKKGMHAKAINCQRSSLAVLETRVFGEINANPNSKAILKQNAKFVSSMNIMLQGYLNMGMLIENCEDLEWKQQERLDSAKLYKNGEKISRIFLGKERRITKALKKSLDRLFSQRVEPDNDSGDPPLTQRTSAKARLNMLLDANPQEIHHQSSGNNSLNSDNLRPNLSLPIHRLSRKGSKDFLLKSGSLSKRSQGSTPKSRDEELEDLESGRMSTQRIRHKISLSLERRSNQSDSFRRRQNIGASGSLLNSSNKALSILPLPQNSIFKMDLEERIEKKIEQTFRRLKLEEEEQLKMKKKQEIEAQIQQLKKESEQARLKKQEKLLELEKLRMRSRNASDSAEPRSYNNSQSISYGASPLNYNPPAFFNNPAAASFSGRHKGMPNGPAPNFYAMDPMSMFPGFYYPMPGGANPQFFPNQREMFPNSTLDDGGDDAKSQTSLTSIDPTTNKKKFNLNEVVNETQQSNQTPKLPGSRQELQTPKSGTITPKSGSMLNDYRVLNQQSIQFRAFRNKDQSTYRSNPASSDEDVPKPIMKTETFGAGILGSIIADFKKQNATKSPEPVIEVIHEKSQSDVSGTHNNIGSLNSMKAESLMRRNSNYIPSIFMGGNNQVVQPENRGSEPEKVAPSIILKENVEEPMVKESEDRKSDQSPATTTHQEQTQGLPRRGSVKKFEKLTKKESMNSSIDSKIFNPVRVIPSMSKLDSELGEEMGKNDMSSLPNGWHDSLQDGTITPKPMQLLDDSEIMILPETSVLTQEYFGVDDDRRYIIECHYLAKNIFDPKVKIILTQQTDDQKGFKPIAEEMFRFKGMKPLLQQLDYLDVLPSIMTVKSIKSYRNFIAYLLLPFVWIAKESEADKLKIHVRAKAKGLFSIPLECVFLNESCRISLNSVGGTNFKIVIDTLNQEYQYCLRFDLSLDQGSFDKYFENYHSSGPVNMGDNILTVINTLEDDTTDATDLDNVHEIIKTHGDPKKLNEEIEVCRFKGKNEENQFVELMEQLMINAVNYFAEKGIDSMAKATDPSSIKYYKFRVWNESNRKDLIIMLENQEKNQFKLLVKNLYESHAPEGIKALAEGIGSYDIERFWKDFGVNYGLLDTEDRLALCSVVSDCFRIEVFDKPLVKSEYAAYNKKLISVSPVEYGCFERNYRGAGYKYPLTTSLVGIRGHPVGVRATVYKPSECSEQGVFFLLDTTNWKKIAHPNQKNKKNRKFADLPMVEEYNLTAILKSYGFKVIEDYLEIDETDEKIEILGVKSKFGLCNVDVLENPLSFRNFIKYLKEKTELLEGLEELQDVEEFS